MPDRSGRYINDQYTVARIGQRTALEPGRLERRWVEVATNHCLSVVHAAFDPQRSVEPETLRILRRDHTVDLYRRQVVLLKYIVEACMGIIRNGSQHRKDESPGEHELPFGIRPVSNDRGQPPAGHLQMIRMRGIAPHYRPFDGFGAEFPAQWLP